jgi:hypothetical protein
MLFLADESCDACMKRKDLIRQIESLGCILIRHGGCHDILKSGVTTMNQDCPSGQRPRPTRSGLPIDILAILHTKH